MKLLSKLCRKCDQHQGKFENENEGRCRENDSGLPTCCQSFAQEYTKWETQALTVIHEQRATRGEPMKIKNAAKRKEQT